jgi:PhnB protein
MTKKVKAIPEGYHAVTPYLIIKDAGKAIQFYQTVFSADVLLCMKDDNEKVCHAELKIGDSIVMLADEFVEMDALSPQTLKGSTCSFNLYVEDADAVFNKAVNAGAIIKKPIQNQFYGDRSGCVTDPFGHVWNIATHIEDVTPEEIEKRIAALKQA